jgi:hypothetical protein
VHSDTLQLDSILDEDDLVAPKPTQVFIKPVLCVYSS